MTVDFYVNDLGHDNMVRVTFYNCFGDNFWYDIKATFAREHYFWYPESEGYAKLYFIGEGFSAPKWVKQGCGWR
jgi:hypothetical protein